MRNRSRLIVAGIVTFVIGLILYFPARVAYQWFAPPGLALSGIGGSIWSGRASEAHAGGMYLRDLRWSMRPLSLFTGKLDYSIEATPASGYVEGNITLAATGSVTMTDLDGSLPLQSLERVSGMSGLRGMLNVEFERLKFEDGLPVFADGEAQVADLVAPLIYRASIGGYRAEFFTQDSGVIASVEDTDGVVDVAGSLQISADRSYQFIAQLAPKANTPSQLRQQMQLLGTPNNRGQYELRLEGKL